MLVISSDHKPITEAELREMEREYGLERGHLPAMARLIAEIRRLQRALEVYGTPSQWAVAWSYAGREFAEVLFAPDQQDLRSGKGYQLARDVLGWDPPDEPCDNPSCDGVKDDKTFGAAHRCFKDGRWLDDGSEM